MFYYEIATNVKTRGSTAIFTYEYAEDIEIGTIVDVIVRGKKCLGFIVKKVTKPSFSTLSLQVYSPMTVLPKESVATYNDLIHYYPFAEATLAGLFTPPPASKSTYKTAEKSVVAEPLPSMNDAQKEVVRQLESTKKNSLLHGETGSGKTRVYMHLIQKVLDSGKNAVLLAPEIGLAMYLYKELELYFPNIVAYHSTQTTKERYTNWLNVLNADQGQLVIGPRSVLGLPIKNIGLIILDEAHDASYRQDSAPYLHAKTFAAVLAQKHGAKCVYGTATPGVVDYQVAKSLGNPIATIPELAVKSDKKTEIRVVSYETPGELVGGSLLKSSIEAISNAVKQGGQALVLVNRRGTARYVACGNCGHEQRCSKCDHLVVYHHDSYELRCHFCDRRYPVPSSCSECGAYQITMRSFGTKAVVDELTKIFPDVTIKRFDTDSAKKDHLLSHTEQLKSGEIQIVVGTQMIAKGLDLPKLRTLIMLTSSSGGGFASEERDFQLIYQVIGRAMRGHQDTRVILQTSSPDSPAMVHAVARKYDDFLSYELDLRKKFYYPPYCHMMIIHYKRKSPKGAEKAGKALYEKLVQGFSKVLISGPLSDMTERIGADYYWHMLVKSPKRSVLVDIALEIGSSWICELDPIDTP